MFNQQDNSWSLRQKIEGENDGEHFGSNVIISSDGNKIGVSYKGGVRIYELNNNIYEKVNTLDNLQNIRKLSSSDNLNIITVDYISTNKVSIFTKTI